MSAQQKSLLVILAQLWIFNCSASFALEVEKPGKFTFATERGCFIGRHGTGDMDPNIRAKYPNLPHLAIIDTHDIHAFDPDWNRPIFTNHTVELYRRGMFSSIPYYPSNAGETYINSTDYMTRVLPQVLAGSLDAQIRLVAQTIKNLQIPVQLCLWKEFTGGTRKITLGGPDDYTMNNPWPERFAEAWRRIWNIFENEGANTYVDWGWAGAIYMPLDWLGRFYPGAKYVDTVGWDGGSYEGSAYITDDEFVNGYLFMSRNYPDKPIALFEEKTGWQQQADILLHYMYNLKTFPKIKYINHLDNDWVWQKTMWALISDRLTPVWDEISGAFIVPDDITDVYEPKGLNEPQVFSLLSNDAYYLKYMNLPLSEPGNGRTIIAHDGTITLKWFPLRDAMYAVKWSSDPGFPQGQTTMLSTTNANTVLSTLNDYSLGSPVYWQVKATHLQTGITLAESEIYSFNVEEYEFKEILDQYLDNPLSAGDMSVSYRGMPVGQTFTLGNGVTRITGIEILCKNKYTSDSVTSPTLSIYDSPARNMLLAKASIPGFSGDFAYKWRRWDIKCEGLSPNTMYYMEITTPGDGDAQMTIRRDLTPDTYPRGAMYYTDYNGGMSPYSDDLCFKLHTTKEVSIDQYLDWPFTDAAPIEVGYRGQPIGQTFTMGANVDNICKVKFLCASYYGLIATRPTVSLYDSPQKNMLLAQASIEGFSDRTYRWREWDLHYDGLSPNTMYYLEITTPGDADLRMNVLRNTDPQFYPGGELYYTDYNGGMSSYSDDLYFVTYFADNANPVISYNYPLKTDSEAGRGLETPYLDQPIGQTFITGTNTETVNGIALICGNYYSSSVISPTVTIYDSIQKRIQLAQASIKGFSNEVPFKWRFWPIHSDLMEPDKKYYFEVTTEVTTPGGAGNQMIVMTGNDGSAQNNMVYAYPQGALGESVWSDLRFAIHTKNAPPTQTIYGLKKIESAAFNGRVAKFTTIDLAWDAIANARSYRVQCTQDSNFDGDNVATIKVGRDEYGALATKYSIVQPATALGLNSTWNWRVYAEDNDGNIISISPTYSFIVNNIYDEVVGPALQPATGDFGPNWIYKTMARDVAAPPVLVATQDFTTDSDMNQLLGIDLAISGLYSSWRIGKTTVEIQDVVTGQIIGASERESNLVESRVAKWFHWQFAAPLPVTPGKQYRIKLWMTPALLCAADSAIVVHNTGWRLPFYYRVYKSVPAVP